MASLLHENIHPLSQPKKLKLDERSKFLRISCKDFTTKFMYQLVFNIDGIVHRYPCVKEHPYFVPLEIGEYISIVDGNSVENIYRTRTDSLSPWNKNNSRSKQHSLIVDLATGDCQRADTRADRELSNAKEYYAKHPNQGVTKRIFFAIAPNSNRPQSNTFVVIYYKVEEVLYHQSLVNKAAICQNQNQEPEEAYDEDEEASNIEVKEESQKQEISLFDDMLFTNGSPYPTESNGISNAVDYESPSTSSARQNLGRKRPAVTESSISPPPVPKKPAKITILYPHVPSTSKATTAATIPPSTRMAAATVPSTSFIRKRHFGLFEHTPFPCDPPADLQNTPQSSHLDQAVKNYYKSNNLSVEAYHTSFPFQLQKSKDLEDKGKRKCAHCNAEITVADNSTVITHYEPFEYLIPGSSHITTGHGNRIICVKFSCLKARYPFVDEECFVVNDTVSQIEAKNVFNLIF